MNKATKLEREAVLLSVDSERVAVSDRAPFVNDEQSQPTFAIAECEREVPSGSSAHPILIAKHPDSSQDFLPDLDARILLSGPAHLVIDSDSVRHGDLLARYVFGECARPIVSFGFF